MKRLLRHLLVAGAGVTGLYAQAQVEISAEVGRDLIPIANGDITSGDPGQFFGVVDGGIVDGETSSKRIRYQLKNSGDKLLRIDLDKLFLTPSDFRLVGVPDPSNEVWTVQPNETKNFFIEYVPTTQSSGAIFELRNVVSAGVEPIIFQFAVSGRGNLGEPEVFNLLNGTERPIENGDTNPTFNKGTNFGDVLVGETEISPLMIRHGGSSGDTLKISGASVIGADAGSFVVTNLNGTLSDGVDKVFGVSFTPQSLGEKTATVRFSTNDPDNSIYTFNVRGNGEPEQGILVEGRSGNSGPYRLISDGSAANAGASNGTFFLSTFDGQSRTNTFRITNTGGADLTMSGAGASSPFSATPIPGSLGPGESTEFSITFAPTERGSYSSSYAFLTNLPGNLGLFSFALAGGGLGPEGPEITVEREGLEGVFSDAPNNFWTAPTSFEGDPPMPSPDFRIRNTGNQVLTVTGITLSGAGSEQVTVEGGLSFPFDVAVGAVSPEFFFSLTPTLPNPNSITLGVEFSAGAATKSHQIRISRVVAASSMTVSGKKAGGVFLPVSSGGLAQVANGTGFLALEGGGPVTSTFRLTNTHGSESLLFGNPEFTGPHAADFSIDGFSTAALAPGESREFTVTFDSAETTERTATLEFLSNDLNIRIFEINLLGNAPEDSEVEASIVNLAITGSDGVFSVITDPAKNYRLRRSPSMADGTWVNVPGIGLIVGSTVLQEIPVTDVVDPLQFRYFYRLEEEE